jgi:sec-independent protein translocase protein TatB
MFDLSVTKLLVLAVIGLVLFGPDQLPKMAGQAGQFLRDLRRMAEQAKTDLHQGLGPEFAEFDLADLHPRTFVRKHLLDGPEGLDGLDSTRERAARPHPMAREQRPPFDTEAT